MPRATGQQKTRTAARPWRRFACAAGAIACVVAVLGLVQADEPSGPPRFERDVWPILSLHCTSCHAGAKPKGELDLTSVTALLRGGESGPAVDQSAPDASPLVEKIASGEMPPADRRKLSAEEVAILRAWIRVRACRPIIPMRLPRRSPAVVRGIGEFWSFRPLARPAFRCLATSPRRGRRSTPFSLARLELEGLAFSPDADPNDARAARLSRLAGLAAVARGGRCLPAADAEPAAFERLVDRLLASPHFGERWGRHWLDVAGYVDTVGFDTDATNIILSEGKWRYRDYVIRAVQRRQALRPVHHRAARRRRAVSTGGTPSTSRPRCARP